MHTQKKPDTYGLFMCPAFWLLATDFMNFSAFRTFPESEAVIEDYCKDEPKSPCDNGKHTVHEEFIFWNGLFSFIDVLCVSAAFLAFPNSDFCHKNVLLINVIV